MIISNFFLVLSLLLLGSSLFVQARFVSYKTPCTFIWGGMFLLLFCLFPFINNVFYGYALSVKAFGAAGEYIKDDSVYVLYSIVVLSFSSWYCLAVAFVYYKAPCADIKHLQKSTNFRGERRIRRLSGFLHVATGMVVILGLAIFVKGTGLSFSELMVASRFQWFAQGTMDAFTLNLGLYLIGLISVFAYYDVKLRFPKKWFSVLVYSSIFLMIALSGGRKWLLFLGSGIIAGFFDRMGGRLPVSKKIISVGFLIFFLSFSWQFGRKIEWQHVDSLVSVGQDFAAQSYELFSRGDATYFYRASLDAIQVNKNEQVLFPLGVVRRVLLLPIPEGWTFGVKPEGLPALFADVMGAETAARRGNLPPGLIGLFVLSFDYLFVTLFLPLLVIPMLIALDRYIVRSRKVMRNVVFASFAFASMLFMRGSTGGIYFLVFNVLATVAIAFVFLTLSSINNGRLNEH